MPITSHRWTRPATSLTLSLFALTACTSPQPTPIPSSTTEVVFASEEEALAAVTATYEEFLRISNQILQDGGSNPERIDAITSPEVAEIEHESYARMRNNGYRTTGDIILSSPRLRQFYTHADSVGVVGRMFACEVISGVDVVNADGVSQVPEGRPSAVGFEILVGVESTRSDHFIIVSKDAEEGASTCR